MKIPKTKDGKHELVFGFQTSVYGPLAVRAPVCSRINYEILRLAEQDPDLVRRLYQKYGSIFKYDIAEDPDILFEDITIPVLAEVDPDSVTIDGENRRFAGFTEPYVPFVRERRLVPGFFDSDLRNSLHYARGADLISHVGAEEVERALGKHTQYHGKDECRDYALEVLLDGSWRRWMKLWCITCSLSPRSVAADYLGSPGSYPPGYITEVVEHEGRTVGAFPTKDLARRLCEATIALCDEYLSEME